MAAKIVSIGLGQFSGQWFIESDFCLAVHFFSDQDSLMNSIGWLPGAWEVLVLFLIPVGGGIPAGVLLARTKGFDWQAMLALYFVSDVILACVFEPLMLLFIRAGRHSAFFARFNAALKMSTQKTILRYGVNLGPFALIMISFGVDPMTGRSVAFANGHRFISGWSLAIIGDMIFFSVLMVSTLWLNNILGDGTWTAIIITVAMIAVPALIRRVREQWKTKPSA